MGYQKYPPICYFWMVLFALRYQVFFSVQLKIIYTELQIAEIQQANLMEGT